MTTTAIEITYVFDDGRRVPMGTGTINSQGQIDVTNPASGQEDYIKGEIDELNSRDYVILKEPPGDPELSRFAITKRKVYRGEPEFLSAIKNYGERVYSMDFDFDIEAIQPSPPAPDDIEVEEQSAPEPDPDAIGAAAEFEDDDLDLDEPATSKAQ